MGAGGRGDRLARLGDRGGGRIGDWLAGLGAGGQGKRRLARVEDRVTLRELEEGGKLGGLGGRQAEW